MRDSRSGVARVTSSPRKRIRPLLARSSPESRFRNVDFPAPFGPITAWTRPSWKASETPSTAASAPKRRVRPSVSSSGSATRGPLHEAGQAAGKKEHDRDHQKRDQRVPVLGDALAVVLDEREQKRPEGRTIERPPAAEQDGDEHQTGLTPSELGRIDEAVQGCVEVTGEAGETSRDDEGDQLVASGRIAE